MKFHHLGVAVADIGAAAGWWTELCGFHEASAIIHDPLQKVRVQFFEAAGEFRIELVEPAAEDSPVRRYVDKEDGGIYHICYEVADLEQTMRSWRQRGAFPVTKPLPAAAFNGRPIVFLLTPAKQLVELVQVA